MRDTDVEVSNRNEIQGYYEEEMYRVYGEIQEYVDGRDDLDLSDLKFGKEFLGTLFDIVLNSGEQIHLTYKLDIMDEPGMTSSLDVFCNDGKAPIGSIEYQNGAVEYNSEENMYEPLVENSMDKVAIDSLIENIKELIPEYEFVFDEEDE